MKIFNLGALEILFIVLLALIVLGPKKTIKVIGDVTRWVKDFIKSPLWKELLSTSKEIRDLPKKVMEDDEFISSMNNKKSRESVIGSSLSRFRRSISEQLNEVSDQIQNDDQIETNSTNEKDQES